MANSMCCAMSIWRSRGAKGRPVWPLGFGQIDFSSLRQPAGRPSGRAIFIDGPELTDDPRGVEMVRREVGMVFQHFNLFPHLTALENCMLEPVDVRKLPQKEAEALARHFLEKSGSRNRLKISRRPFGRPAATRGHRPRFVY